MAMNRIKTLLREGKPALGAIVTMPSPQVMQVMARSGFDWLLIALAITARLITRMFRPRSARPNAAFSPARSHWAGSHFRRSKPSG